ncbi:MAG TPA: DUF2231 domain-containing protein [Candidatus Thermoplasmatota archaeon]|nr:DUF2231 domain-containing protein [Candidatus Thermoplasmatota archaeon]
MQSKVRIFGHAVHPMLVDFPIVVFAVLAILDVAQGMGALDPGKVPILLVGVGGGVAVLAILTGLVDFFFLPKPTRAHKLAGWHFAGGILVWLWFGAASWGHTSASLTAATAVDLVGVLLVIAQSWLGGELMERHHVGIRAATEGADPVVLSRKTKSSDRKT